MSIEKEYQNAPSQPIAPKAVQEPEVNIEKLIEEALNRVSGKIIL